MFMPNIVFSHLERIEGPFYDGTFEAVFDTGYIRMSIGELLSYFAESATWGPASVDYSEGAF